MNPAPLDRRAFLARVGILGAVAGSGLALSATAMAAAPAPAASLARQGLLIDLLRPVLDLLARDTMNACAVFVAPGPDIYSSVQGTPRAEAGAIEARTPEYLIDFLDNFVPLPPEFVTLLGSALADGLAGVPITLPIGLPLLPGLFDSLDDLVRELLRTPEAVPLSLLVALLMNFLATQVRPSSVVGVLGSPFARLSFGEKAHAFGLLEGPDTALVAALDGALPEPLRGTVSGLMRFLSGALIELAAFGTYSEWSKFDPATRRVTGKPVGWTISHYNAGVLHGWDEFKGYYQGRRKVSA